MIQVDLDGKIYQIDEYGNILKRRGTGFLQCFPDKDGYLKVTIRFSRTHTYNEYLHRVVYRAFHGEIPEGMTVDHIDGDKLNNHKDNLQLITAIENAVKGNALWWEVTNPAGEVFEVYNLKKFCRENTLHDRHIVSRGYKGWKAKRNDSD